MTDNPDDPVLVTGTVTFRNEGVSDSFSLQGTSADTQPVLDLRNVALSGNIEVVGAPNTENFGEIKAAGVVTSSGNVVIGGGRGGGTGDLTIDIRGGATFVNTGTIVTDNAGPPRNGGLTVEGGTFFNNGTVISFVNQPLFDTRVIGTGTFDLLPSLDPSGFHFGKSVSSGITVLFNSQGQPQQVAIDKPLRFLAEIDRFGLGLPNSIDLPNTPEAKITSETFADNHLNLFEGHRLVADLNIAGDFTVDNFALSADQSGGTLITFTNTPAAMAMTATTDQPIMPDMLPPS
jgi:hypothetical protein